MDSILKRYLQRRPATVIATGTRRKNSLNGFIQQLTLGFRSELANNRLSNGFAQSVTFKLESEIGHGLTSEWVIAGLGTAPAGRGVGSGAKSAVFDQPGPEFAGFLAGHLKLAGYLEPPGAPTLAGTDWLRSAAGDGDALSVGAELEGLAVVEAEGVSHGWW